MKQSNHLTINKSLPGQALITLIFISVICITIATGAIMLIYINSQSTLKVQQGNIAYQIAQSGAENALLRLLRDPAYRGDANIPVGDGFVDVQISSGSGTFIATSSGRLGNFRRSVQINAHYNADYELVLDSRKEIF